MIVLKRKRILLIVFAVMIAVFVPINNNKTVETVALPVTNKVIVLDAGHRDPR